MYVAKVQQVGVVVTIMMKLIKLVFVVSCLVGVYADLHAQVFLFKPIPVPPSGDYSQPFPSPDGTLFVSGPKKKLYRTTDDGVTWDSLRSDVESITVQDTNRLFAIGAGISYFSSDNGLTWVLDGDVVGSYIMGVAIAPSGNRFYCVKVDSAHFAILRVDTNTHTSILGKARFIGVLEMQIAASNVIYAHVPDQYGLGCYVKSEDLGDSYKVMLCPSGTSSCFVVDSWENVFIGISDFEPPPRLNSQGLRVSRDKGVSFHQGNSPFDNQHVWGLAIDNKDRLITDALEGFFYSSDDGTTWNSGVFLLIPPNYYKFPMKFINGRLYVASQSGMWIARDTTGILSVTHQLYSKVDAYPSPATTKIHFRFLNTFSGNVSIRIYDLLGRLVNFAMDKTIIQDRSEIEYDVASLPNGIYYYLLQIGEQSETNPLIVVH